MIHATTVIAVRHGGKVAMAGDGQVSFNNMVLKHGARKVRRIYHDQILAGFAGLPRMRLRSLPNLKRNSRSIEAICRAAVELAKDWRTDRVLRRLEALLAVADLEHSLIVSGTGDVIEPDDGIIGIGSGGLRCRPRGR